MELQQLLEEHGAASWDKQMLLADLIGDGDWQLTISAGRITFGGRQSFPVQILGSEADDAQTWLWSWANSQSNLPAPLLLAAEQLREFGAQNDVPEFVDPSFGLDVASGHQLSLIASGLCGADAYYRGPYEGGAVFLLLSGAELRQPGNDTALRFIRIFNGFIMAVPCNHRAAFCAYARYKEYALDVQGDALIATHPAGAQVRAVFDAHDRMTEMTSTLTAENSGLKPAKKPWWKRNG